MEPELRIVSGIPDRLSCSRDSKSEDFGFHERKIVGFRNPDSLTWGDTRRHKVRYLLVVPVCLGQDHKVRTPLNNLSMSLFTFRW